MSPSPYGDSCFSDIFLAHIIDFILVAIGLRPLTGIRVSLTGKGAVGPGLPRFGLRPLTGIRVSLTLREKGCNRRRITLSPSPYGDSCFSDSLVSFKYLPGVFRLRPLTGIRVSLTNIRKHPEWIEEIRVSVPLRGFVFL